MLGDDVVDGRVEAVLEQCGNRAVGVVREGELLGVGEPRQHALPRGRRAEQQQPADPAAVSRLRGAAVGQHPEGYRRPFVDERGVPLNGQAPRAPLERLRDGARRSTW